MYFIMKRVINFTMTIMYTMIMNDPERITIDDTQRNHNTE